MKKWIKAVLFGSKARELMLENRALVAKLTADDRVAIRQTRERVRSEERMRRKIKDLEELIARRDALIETLEGDVDRLARSPGASVKPKGCHVKYLGNHSAKGRSIQRWVCPCGAETETTRRRQSIGKLNVPSKCASCGKKIYVDVPERSYL